MELQPVDVYASCHCSASPTNWLGCYAGCANTRCHGALLQGRADDLYHLLCHSPRVAIDATTPGRGR